MSLISNRARTALGAAAGLAMTVALAAPAAAAVSNERSTFSFEPEAFTTCGGGEQITLGFDGIRNIHTITDDAGQLVRWMRNIRFTGTFRLVGTGRQFTFTGTRIVEYDAATNLFTSIGNVRTITLPGLGLLMHETGRYVQDLDTEERYFSSGPKYSDLSPDPEVRAEVAAAVCTEVFGLTG
jgi:hypothetical protein